MSPLSLFLLGAPRLERDGQPVLLERRKALALLAYLALTGEPHRREALAALLWPEIPAAEARAALRRALSALNSALGGEGLDVQRDLILAPGGAMALDVAEFRRLAASSEPEPLAEAIGLYRGDFMAGFSLRDSAEFDDWQFHEAEALRRDLASVLEKLACAYMTEGDYRAALDPARRWVALDPLHEPAQQLLMKCYAWAGQAAAALRVYQEVVRLLDTELGTAPAPETVRLYDAVRAGQLAPPVRRAAGSHSRPAGEVPGELRPGTRLPRRSALPAQTTPLLGRAGELARLAERLADSQIRLLAVIGPGGSGKTRLALQAAANHGARTGHPVYFVPLAGTEPAPGALMAALAEALDLTFYEPGDSTAQLLDALRDRPMLLLLDNFEHLLPHAGLLADILAQAPSVRLMVTSRERLHLHGEWVLELGGLPFPPGPHAPNIDFYDAVQLFVHSARRAHADFSLDDSNRAAVVEICRLVEGLPLGLELAAPWVRVLAADEIAAEITRNLDFLATTRRDVPERHRSLRAAFEHSWHLLPEPEQQSLASLAVFRGPFGREAAEAVAGAGLPVLAALVDKSLLHGLPPRHGAAQYALHELMRQFAAERLGADPGQTRRVGARHARYFAQRLAQNIATCDKNAAAVGQMAADIENVRAAWQWALDHEDAESVELAHDGLFKIFQWQSWYEEGAEAFERAAARFGALANALPGDSPEGHRHLRLWGALLWRQGALAHYLGSSDQAKANLAQGLALLRAHGEPRDLAHTLMRTALLARERGELAEARQLFAESLAVNTSLDDAAGMAAVLSMLGYMLGELGEFEAAAQRLGQARELAQRAGPNEQASALNNAGYVAYLAGDLDRAEALLLESLALRRAAQHQHGTAIALINLGFVAVARADLEAARAQFGESLRLAQSVRSVPIMHDAALGLTVLLPPAEAVEVLTFVLEHPVSWRESKERAERWLAERAADLPRADLAAAQARGRTRTTNEVVESLLRQVSP